LHVEWVNQSVFENTYGTLNIAKILKKESLNQNKKIDLNKDLSDDKQYFDSKYEYS
jgi:hypothetical protein